MPAKWPIFVNKVSAKLSSLSSSSIDEFAVFLAGEYFNSVKTSQTMYGNMHQSGQKSILEEGFKKAFKKIYEEEDVKFENKFTESKYADMFEKAPGPNVNFDALCELEKWTDKNKENLEKFVFYPLFKSTCPIEEPPTVTGEIDFNLLKEAEKPGEPEKYITMSISGFTEGIDYRFLYSINGVDQPLQIAPDNVLVLPAPTLDGTYTYIFKAVYDADGISLLKEINKQVVLNLTPDGVEVIEDVKDPFADKKPRQSVPQMTEEEMVNNIALRVAYQNDGSAEYGEWVDRLDIGYDKEFGKKVKKKVYEISGIGSTGTYNKIKESIANKRALEKAIRFRDDLLSRFNKQGNQFSVFGLTKADIEKSYQAELKKYQKEYRNNLTEGDIIKAMLSEDKTLKKSDALRKLYEIPKPKILENPINEYVFQEEHIDNTTIIPSWITAAKIAKYVFFKSIDKRMEGYSDREITVDLGFPKLDRFRFERAELQRNTRKIAEYKKEKEKWYELLRKWGNSQTGNLEEETTGGDGYDVMAQAIIDYWKSTAVQPFKSSPPIPPCTSVPPLGGKYAPISYGNKTALANDLRKAWNTGKRFKMSSLTPVASKSVASAVSVACSKHLLGVKFLYLGGLIVPSGPPIPMVGISPTVF